nr:LCP family protein [Adlercreutzia sp. ZJ473]
MVLLSGCQSSSSGSSEERSGTDLAVSDHAQTNDVRYIAVIGDDEWEKYSPGRSDLLMLARVDLANSLVTLVTIPRDTAYTWEDGSKIKVNMAYERGGAEAACKAVSTIAGVPVTDYVTVGFDGLQSIVGYFNGIEVDVPYDFSYSFYTKDFPDEEYTAGVQTLDPWRVMAISRARTGYPQYGFLGDVIRQAVDRQMLTTMLDLVLSAEDPAGTAEALLPFVETNIAKEDALGMITQLSQADEVTVYGTTGPVNGDTDAESGLWLTTYYPDRWEKLMQVVDLGGDPSTVNVQDEGFSDSPEAPINTKTVLTPQK